jgi:hypothetical protein
VQNKNYKTIKSKIMKITNLLIAAFCGLTLNIQSQTYNFSVSTGSYSDLTGSISLNNGMTWDDPQFTIPIGFNFQYFNTTMNQIFLDDLGLGGELSSDTSETGIYALLIPYGADIIDRGYDFNVDSSTTGSLSNVSYILEGTSGNRILKIEWKNVGFYSELEDDNISSDFTNFQLWLYEGSNDIEIHFGPNSITQPNLSFDGETGSYVGLFPEYDFDNDSVIGNGIVLSGNPSSPNALSVDSIYANYLNGVILNGTIYKFTKSAVGISELMSDFLKISIYPNPSDDYFNISFDNVEFNISSISILNTNGQKAKEINFDNDVIDISDLSSGTYFVQLNTKSGIALKKLIKK